MAPQTPAAAPPEQDGLAARLGSKIRKWKDLAKQAQDARDAEAKKVADLEAKVKALEERPPDAAAVELAKLKQDLREKAHRAEFDKLATAAGATTEAQRNDLWRLSEYKAEGETPDPAAIAAVINAQKAERAHLFGGVQQQQADGQPPAKPGPGSGRGRTDPDQGVFQITRAEANDPLFMRDNSAKIWKAQLENRFSIAETTLTR
jgi:hypothetical protein